MTWNRMYSAMLATPLRRRGRARRPPRRRRRSTSWWRRRSSSPSPRCSVPSRSWWVLLAVPVGAADRPGVRGAHLRLRRDGRERQRVQPPLSVPRHPAHALLGSSSRSSQLPVALRVIAWLTPLWHGVELSRDAATGTPPAVGRRRPPHRPAAVHRSRVGRRPPPVHAESSCRERAAERRPGVAEPCPSRRGQGWRAMSSAATSWPSAGRGSCSSVALPSRCSTSSPSASASGPSSARSRPTVARPFPTPPSWRRPCWPRPP